MARTGSVALVVALCWANAAGAATINFAGLAPGTQLGTQFQAQGVTFLPYNGVNGVVRAAATGKVAQFDSCFACEFYNSGGKVVFSTLHQTVTFHAGLASTTPAVTGPLLMQVYDAGGNVLGSTSVNVTSGTDFTTALTVTVPTARIAAATIEVGQSIAETDVVAISDLSFEDNATMLPDFSLDGPAAVGVLAGSLPTLVNINILRIGGSVGPINFSVAGLPPGVTGTFSPNPATGNSVVLSLGATANAPEFATNATITALPTPAAGPQVRQLTLGVDTHRPLSISTSPVVVDFAKCSSPDLTNGSVTVTIEVTRDPTVLGPLALTLSGLPGNVTSSFAPATLTFPGGALRQSAVLTLSVLDGIAIGSTFVTVQAAGGGQQIATPFLLGGTCPRNNSDFTIQGSWFCDNLGAVLPLASAQVEIFRFHDGWYDDLVGSQITDANGAYSLHVHANDVGDYYARIRLDDKTGVHLNNFGIASVFSRDSPHLANANPIVDIGAQTLIRNNGTGTPHCAIWTGAHLAFQEFLQTRGFLPPEVDYTIVVWPAAETPWSSLGTTNWPDNYPTNGQTALPPVGLPSTMFTDYLTSFHEFGHTVRHTLDGDVLHWINDAAQYNYAHAHSHCDGNNDGFAFNEGWAEYWSKDTSCCHDYPGEWGNFKVEGSVAHELDDLSQCPGVGRKGMVEVLEQGINIVHSVKDFHAFFLQRFPSCSIPPAGQGCIGVGGGPLTSSGGGCAVAPPAQPTGGPEGPLDPGRQRAELQAKIDEQNRRVAQLRIELASAQARAQAVTRCGSRDCDREMALVMAPSIAQGGVEQAQLLLGTLRAQTRLLDRGDLLRQAYAQDFNARQRVNALIYDQARRQIVINAARQAGRSLEVLRSGDGGGAVATRIDELQRRLRLLESPDVHADDAILSFVRTAPLGDDVVTPGRVRSAPPASRRGWLVALAVALGALLLVAFVRMRRSRHA